MPALITHYLHALDVFKEFKEMNLNKEAFCLGAQGPDFLYFHRALPILQPGKSLRKLGNLIHKQEPDKLFACFGDYLNKNKHDIIILSYALGFICHYSLDRTAHPFIFSVQSNIIKKENIRYNPSYVHSRIEHNLDVITLRTKQNVFANEFKAQQCITSNVEVLEKSALLLEYVVNKLQIYKVNHKQILRAFLDLRSLQKMSYDPLSIKKPLIRLLEKICFMPESFSTFIRPMMEDSKFDYSNFENNEWRNPFDNSSSNSTNESFFDVFNNAVKDSILLINKFNDCLNSNSYDFTDNLSFKTGLKM